MRTAANVIYSANGIARTSHLSIVRHTAQLSVNYRLNTMLTCAQLYLDNTGFLFIFRVCVTNVPVVMAAVLFRRET